MSLHRGVEGADRICVEKKQDPGQLVSLERGRAPRGRG